jgi:hypothetical protein
MLYFSLNFVAALSEPETQALHKYVTTHRKERRKKIFIFV